jgi:hypothetical protein
MEKLAEPAGPTLNDEAESILFDTLAILKRWRVFVADLTKSDMSDGVRVGVIVLEIEKQRRALGELLTDLALVDMDPEEKENCGRTG